MDNELRRLPKRDRKAELRAALATPRKPTSPQTGPAREPWEFEEENMNASLVAEMPPEVKKLSDSKRREWLIQNGWMDVT